MMTEVNDTAIGLHRAARALAGMDSDRARERNGIGYNGTDSAFGHSLAATPPEAWSPDVVRSAWLVLRKYQGQLAALGIDFSDIPLPPAADDARVDRDVRSIDFEGGMFILRFKYGRDLIDKVRGIPGRRWNADEKRWEVPRSGAGYVSGFAKRWGFRFTAGALEAMAGAETVTDEPDVTGRVDLDEHGLVISFPYDRKLLDAVRGLPMRSWDADGRVWRCPVVAVRAVRLFAAEHGFTIADAVAALPDAELRIAARIEVRGGQFLIKFPYDRDIIERVRQIPGAAWNGKVGAWTAPLDAAYEVAEFAATGTMEIADSAIEALAEARAALLRIAASAATAAEIHIPGLGGTLRPFQAAGVLYALQALGFTQAEDGSWAA